MVRTLMLAACMLAPAAGPAAAQFMTEQFIPIGRSPGVSGVLSVIGTIEAVDLSARSMRITGPQGPVTYAFADSTHIWVDRSTQGRSALVGSTADLVVGRRAEVKFESAERRDFAEWIKVEGPAGGAAREERMPTQ